MEATATLTLEQKLAMIAEQMEAAKGDSQAQIRILESGIIDPQDVLACEGCQ